MKKKHIDYTKPLEWDFAGINDPEHLKNICDRFNDPESNLPLSKFLQRASKINLMKILKGSRTNINKERTTYEWKHRVEEWSKTIGQPQYVSETAFIIAAVKAGFRFKIERNGYVNYVYFNLPRLNAITKGEPR